MGKWVSKYFIWWGWENLEPCSSNSLFKKLVSLANCDTMWSRSRIICWLDFGVFLLRQWGCILYTHTIVFFLYETKLSALKTLHMYVNETKRGCSKKTGSLCYKNKVLIILTLAFVRIFGFIKDNSLHSCRE